MFSTDVQPADEYYTDEFVRDQVEKFRNRDHNHWRHRVAFVLDRLEGAIGRGGRVLDLACGVGVFTIDGTRRGYDVLGLDFSEHALRTARELAEEAGVACRFELGDATRMELPDASFDGIIAADIVEHLYDAPLQRMFDESFRVLRPGGALVIHTTPTRYRYLFGRLRSLPLVPFAWLPTRALDRVVELYEAYPFTLAYKLVTGRTFDERSRTIGHCNCPSYYRLEGMLRASGFVLEEYRADTSPEDFDDPAYQRVLSVFRRSMHARGHIWAVCRKP
jgi:ubiquinone/menaquinone biosynthesis C-methylase UbiE